MTGLRAEYPDQVILEIAIGYAGRGRRAEAIALLERAVRHLDERRVPSVKLDATPQGRPLYERMGFETEYEIERWLLEREAEPPADLEIARGQCFSFASTTSAPLRTRIRSCASMRSTRS